MSNPSKMDSFSILDSSNSFDSLIGTSFRLLVCNFAVTHADKKLSGSVRASHPAIQDSNHDTCEVFVMEL